MALGRAAALAGLVGKKDKKKKKASAKASGVAEGAAEGAAGGLSGGAGGALLGAGLGAGAAALDKPAEDPNRPKHRRLGRISQTLRDQELRRASALAALGQSTMDFATRLR